MLRNTVRADDGLLRRSSALHLDDGANFGAARTAIRPGMQCLANGTNGSTAARNGSYDLVHADLEARTDGGTLVYGSLARSTGNNG